MRRRPGATRRSVRLRFTVLYGVLFFLSGAVLLAIVNFLALGSVEVSAPAGHQAGGSPPSALVAAHAQIARLQEQLSQSHAHQARQLVVGSAIAMGVMALLSVVLGRFVAARVLRPLRTMTAATRRISAANLHERLAVPGPVDEVKDLADTIDDLLERLEGSFAAQRRFVANASHELRTPLATMRASLDVAVAKPEPIPPQTLSLAGRLRTELDQVDRLLDGLLVLGQAQHGAVFADRATLSLGGLVAEALAARADEIVGAGLTVYDESGGGAPARVQGSLTLLRRMVDNVIDNAIRHNHEGGWIRVAAVTAAGDADHRARLVIETGGRILDQEQVAQLAQPFRRLGADRTGSDGGSGLGLSIVAAIAAAHGGALDLRARAEGGLRVEISLPAAKQGVPA